ncbi:MAG: hypothetical protein KDC76_02485 [Bacteroidetes bacterium]|nr:hypothetical protein [Bacteroidota bacterium]
MTKLRTAVLLGILGLNGVALNTLLVSLHWVYPIFTFLIFAFSLIYGQFTVWLTQDNGNRFQQAIYLFPILAWSAVVIGLKSDLMPIMAVTAGSLWIGILLNRLSNVYKLVALFVGAIGSSWYFLSV